METYSSGMETYSNGMETYSNGMETCDGMEWRHTVVDGDILECKINRGIDIIKDDVMMT